MPDGREALPRVDTTESRDRGEKSQMGRLSRLYQLGASRVTRRAFIAEGMWISSRNRLQENKIIPLSLDFQHAAFLRGQDTESRSCSGKPHHELIPASESSPRWRNTMKANLGVTTLL